MIFIVNAKKLGELLVPEIIKAIDDDFDNTVFSFIPNTAEVAYFGMLQGLEDHFNHKKAAIILEKGSTLTKEEVDRILSKRVRSEKVAIKDIKLRTFISQGGIPGTTLQLMYTMLPMAL